MLLFISLEFNFVSSSYFTGANVSPHKKQILSIVFRNLVPVKICSIIQGVVQGYFSTTPHSLSWVSLSPFCRPVACTAFRRAH